MEQKLKEKKELIAIFTETGFTVDYEIVLKKNLSEENQKNQESWYTRFLEDKYKALWELGFLGQDDWMSQFTWWKIRKKTILLHFWLHIQQKIKTQACIRQNICL